MRLVVEDESRLALLLKGGL
jgi:DNA-binding NarL/FixJ family response regulator